VLSRVHPGFQFFKHIVGREEVVADPFRAASDVFVDFLGSFQFCLCLAFFITRDPSVFTFFLGPFVLVPIFPLTDSSPFAALLHPRFPSSISSLCTTSYFFSNGFPVNSDCVRDPTEQKAT